MGWGIVWAAKAAQMACDGDDRLATLTLLATQTDFEDPGKDEPYQPPDAWKAAVGERDGSWWPALVGWLDDRSSGDSAPPGLGTGSGRYKAVYDAPGSDVFQL